MRSHLRLSLLLSGILLGAPSLGWTQGVPSRLALFQDPTPAVSSSELVLGATTLEEARRIFPEAPAHPGPLTGSGNPGYLAHKPELQIGEALVKLRHAFFPGAGRAVLFFDDHQRLVSIEQGQFAYHDPMTGKYVIQRTPWAATSITRNDFRARYPGTRGEWFDHLHYLIQGPIAQCLGITAWFMQRDGNDELFDLSYHYTCLTQPSRQ
jgi:hypothetical protein